MPDRPFTSEPLVLSLAEYCQIRADLNHDGCLSSYDELARASRARGEFTLFDGDGDGCLSLTDAATHLLQDRLRTTRPSDWTKGKEGMLEALEGSWRDSSAAAQKLAALAPYLLVNADHAERDLVSCSGLVAPRGGGSFQRIMNELLRGLEQGRSDYQWALLGELQKPVEGRRWNHRLLCQDLLEGLSDTALLRLPDRVLVRVLAEHPDRLGRKVLALLKLLVDDDAARMERLVNHGTSDADGPGMTTICRLLFEHGATVLERVSERTFHKLRNVRLAHLTTSGNTQDAVFDDLLVRLGEPVAPVMVALIDASFHPEHPTLRDKFWLNRAEAQGVAGVDDDGNGFIDDLHGWSFVGRAGPDISKVMPEQAVMGGQPFDVGRYEHGTLVCGVATQHSTSIRATAFATDTSHRTDIVPESFEYLERTFGKGPMRPRVLNMSVTLDWENFSGLRQALMDRDDLIVVIAAGNDGVLQPSQSSHLRFVRKLKALYPSQIVVVANADSSGEIELRSNCGSEVVDIAALGTDVFTTAGLGFREATGTSFAAPQVTNLLAKLCLLCPELKAAVLLQILRLVADRPRAWHGLTQWGVLNSDDACRLAYLLAGYRRGQTLDGMLLALNISRHHRSWLAKTFEQLNREQPDLFK